MFLEGNSYCFYGVDVLVGSGREIRVLLVPTPRKLFRAVGSSFGREKGNCLPDKLSFYGVKLCYRIFST